MTASHRRTRSTAIRRIAVVASPLLLLLTGGCGGVKAYERGRLAKPKMLMNPDPQAAKLEQHVYEYREGSTGGYGVTGGGCGCN